MTVIPGGGKEKGGWGDGDWGAQHLRLCGAGAAALSLLLGLARVTHGVGMGWVTLDMGWVARSAQEQDL